MTADASLVEASRDAPSVHEHVGRPSTQCAVASWVQEGLSLPGLDTVIEEVPVALVYNGISHAVMLASPADLEDFAIGFSLTEAIVTCAADIHDVEAVECGDGIELRLSIASSRMAMLKMRRRSMGGRTGCGLCGVESLAQAICPTRAVSPGGRTTTSALDHAFAQLAAQQHLHQATGASHAAGFCNWRGELQLLREDVGRHNALDKLVGGMANASMAGHDGLALVTSRASYEMVNKAAAAGIGMLAALSAPTAMAIRAAHDAGVTLVGFAGRDRKVVYSHAERLSRS